MSFTEGASLISPADTPISFTAQKCCKQIRRFMESCIGCVYGYIAMHAILASSQLRSRKLKREENYGFLELGWELVQRISRWKGFCTVSGCLRLDGRCRGVLWIIMGFRVWNGVRCQSSERTNLHFSQLPLTFLPFHCSIQNMDRCAASDPVLLTWLGSNWTWQLLLTLSLLESLLAELNMKSLNL